MARKRPSWGDDGLTVKHPIAMNILFHPAMVAPSSETRLAIPYATKPPKIWPHPLKLIHSPARRLCSCTVYHWDDRSAKAGILAASKTPRRKRIATAPLKFDTVAKRARTAPQTMTQKAEYLARGSRWSRRLVGYYRNSRQSFPDSLFGFYLTKCDMSSLTYLPDQVADIKH